MRSGGQRGFSLVEVLVAMVVLGVGILGLGLLQVAALRIRQGAQPRMAALRLGGHLLEASALEGRESLRARAEGRVVTPVLLVDTPLVQQWPIEAWMSAPGAVSPYPAFFRSRLSGWDMGVQGPDGGGLRHMEARVEWMEEVGGPIPVSRSLVLVREVAYAGRP